jgi:anti-sigma B factor antagonist
VEEVAQLADIEFSVQLVDSVPVARAPAEMDVTTAGQLRAMLAQRAERGHATQIVDLTGTEFCDSAGLTVLARAHKQALADGGELRLVLPAGGSVVRIFTLTGLDGVIPHFTTLEQALAQLPAAASPPRRPEQSRRYAQPCRTHRAQAREREKDSMSDRRRCGQCGTVFVPRREHARFCSARCRAAWNREHVGDPLAGASALLWSVTAMSEATAWLPQARTWDRARAYAAVGEAVWWVTIVDATLVRHHPDAYDALMSGQFAAQRPLIEATLAGLRYVRNQADGDAGLAPFIQAGAPGAAGHGRITGCRWKPVPLPTVVSLPPRGQAWEISRYQAYQAQLAGRTIGEIFRRAATFLTLAAANAGPLADLATADSTHWDPVTRD